MTAFSDISKSIILFSVVDITIAALFKYWKLVFISKSQFPISAKLAKKGNRLKSSSHLIWIGLD